MDPNTAHANEDLWVFAYGSLMWRPDFPFVERIEALLPDRLRIPHRLRLRPSPLQNALTRIGPGLDQHALDRKLLPQLVRFTHSHSFDGGDHARQKDPGTR